MKSTATHLGPLFLASLLLAACGPSVSGGDDDDDDDSANVDAGGGGDDDDDDDDDDDCVPTGAEVCVGGYDEDCDYEIDCDDDECAGIGDCPASNCGELQELSGSLALPDGEGNAYQNALTFTGFSDGQTLDDINALLGVCVVMEHTWLRDLQMEISCPDGTTTILNMFLGQEGSMVYMGVPNAIDFIDPVPGTGWEYCWTPNATGPQMLNYFGLEESGTLPAGDYASSTPMDALVGCPLNGDWTIKVQDLWAADNGFIFSWGLRFDPAIVEDCDEWPPIE
jgi:hypothetical protein